MQVLKVNNLHKSYGAKQVLCGLELSVEEHRIFGFVGKNGAGKTTAMKAILGLIKTDKGEIEVCGERVSFGSTPTNRHVGYLPDVPEFYSFMTAREYLRLCGECLNMNSHDIALRSDELLSCVGLFGEKHKIGGYSRGMKQRLGIAQALFAKPKLLICDEPTSALDPMGRREILELLLSVRNETTVFLSTHILSDVERICTDIAILNEGRTAFCGSINDMKSRYVRDEFIVELRDKKGFAILRDAFSSRPLDGETLVFSGGESEMLRIMGYINEKGLSVNKIERVQPSLESFFEEVVNK